MPFEFSLWLAGERSRQRFIALRFLVAGLARPDASADARAIDRKVARFCLRESERPSPAGLVASQKCSRAPFAAKPERGSHSLWILGDLQLLLPVGALRRTRSERWKGLEPFLFNIKSPEAPK